MMQLALQDLPSGRGRKSYKVHVLVLDAFVGPRPNGMQGLHRDDDHANNNLSNLYWGTQSQNMADRLRNGRDPNATKTHCNAGHKFTKSNTIVKTRANGRTYRNCRKCAEQYWITYRNRKTA